MLYMSFIYHMLNILFYQYLLLLLLFIYYYI